MLNILIIKYIKQKNKKKKTIQYIRIEIKMNKMIIKDILSGAKYFNKVYKSKKEEKKN